MKILKGRCCISRVTGGDEPAIDITLHGELSACQVVRIRFSLKEFAQAVTSCLSSCEFTYNDSGLVGKKHETKTEEIELPFSPTDSRIAKAVKPYEKNGWIARRDDAKNMHKRVGDGYRIIFDRWLDEEKT